MTASTAVHSNAFNFLSFLATGVDPRTGLYTASISLPELQTNDLRGPGIPLQLGFSPLNTTDSGFGRGWSLQLSQYNTANSVLSLATGETFKVTGTDGNGQPDFREKKLDSFHFHNLGQGRYRVAHKSGLVEILEVGGADGLALPVELYSPQGHKLSLSYRPFNNGGRMLERISDDAQGALLEVQRQGSTVNVLLHPYRGPEGGPLARFRLELLGDDSRLARVHLPTENDACWRFAYDTPRDWLCLTEVHSPVGGHDEIRYTDSGHPFPGGAPHQALPRVTHHRQIPGFGQPLIEVQYLYTTGNFLGFGAPGLVWSDDGLDNLYKADGRYTYGSTEQLWDATSNRPLRSIERTFNNFHLLTREQTEQNDNVKRVDTLYYANPDLPFDLQPPQCQLPQTVTTLWYRKSASAQERRETVHTTYDEHGNLLEQINANGISETSSWYPKEGADGCPADPEGFVRSLRSKTITPAPSYHGAAPVYSTSTLTTDFDDVEKTLTVQRSLLNGESLLEHDDNGVEIAYRYDALGRVLSETVAPETDFKATRSYSYFLVGADGQQAEQVVTDVKDVQVRTRFDGLNRAIFEERQDVDSATRAGAFRQTYAAHYDAFGQLLTETEIDWLGGDPDSIAIIKATIKETWGSWFPPKP